MELTLSLLVVLVEVQTKAQRIELFCQQIFSSLEKNLGTMLMNWPSRTRAAACAANSHGGYGALIEKMAEQTKIALEERSIVGCRDCPARNVLPNIPVPFS